MRYLGGGIGHLEQFPPADPNYEDSAVNDGGNAEAQMDDFILGYDNRSTNSNNECEGDEGDGDEGEEDEGEEDVAGNKDEEEDSDPGESSDEEIGNVY